MDVATSKQTTSKGLARYVARPFVLLLILVAFSGHEIAQEAGALPILDAQPVQSQNDKIKIIRQLTLEPVRLTEISPAGNAIDHGTWITGSPPPGLGAIDTHVVRSAPMVWSMQIDQNEPPPLVDVSYELLAPDGSPDHLGLAAGGTSEIETTMQPIGPTVVQRGNAGATFYEGGVMFTLDLATAHEAGTYAGTLTVTVTYL